VFKLCPHGDNVLLLFVDVKQPVRIQGGGGGGGCIVVVTGGDARFRGALLISRRTVLLRNIKHNINRNINRNTKHNINQNQSHRNKEALVLIRRCSSNTFNPIHSSNTTWKTWDTCIDAPKYRGVRRSRPTGASWLIVHFPP
jgi:hypothetical protein